MLLGDSFHPGGIKLTERLGSFLNLTPQSRVLDVAAGRGTSAIFLAERFGCEVVGIDWSENCVAAASRAAQVKGLEGRVRFQLADAEQLPFADRVFDAIICECAFCTFPNKAAAACEFGRVLRPGGMVGLSDLARYGALPPELEGILSWVACVADARSPSDYVALLSGAALTVNTMEHHNDSLAEFVNHIRTRLLAVEVTAGLRKPEFPGFDFEAASAIVRCARTAIKEGKLGYVIITASKVASADV
ncbi:MAG: class I SAM-dependent methyltransferase [Pseudolabrys sp.]|nr:class I SAM-dependent methyltransferase [Pseudolabrys sp.]